MHPFSILSSRNLGVILAVVLVSFLLITLHQWPLKFQTTSILHVRNANNDSEAGNGTESDLVNLNHFVREPEVPEDGDQHPKGRDALVKYIREDVLPSGVSKCRESRLSFLTQFHEIPRDKIPDMGSQRGVDSCRGKSALYSRLGIFTGYASLSPNDSLYSTSSYNHMILFPCGADDSDRRGFDAFHNVTYHSVMAGPSLVSPVIKQLDVDGLPVWLLSYKVVIPGSYRLKVMVR